MMTLYDVIDDRFVEPVQTVPDLTLIIGLPVLVIVIVVVVLLVLRRHRKGKK